MSRQHRSEIIKTAHKLDARAWVANHDGNISIRLGDNRFLATPTATAKADVCEKNLIEVDRAGKRTAGTARPFSEIAMHLAVFAERPDVGAVVHAHPPYATAIACSGSGIIERPFLAEAIVSIGPLIPTLPFAAPGAASVKTITQSAKQVDCVLLANHGVFSWGATLELAYLRMELVEHLARIATLAQATGGVQPLPESIIDPLLGSRAKAGLGHAADRAMDFANRPVIACAPAPHSRTPILSRKPSQSSAATPSSEQLAAIIKEEIAKLLS
ncbi:MAG: class II aldolase/adducin family protein [Myxococcales bacterium]|nr:class II aldolase/adducin family protein [Myxococcales bacterium]